MNSNSLSFNRLYLKNFDGLSNSCWIGIIINFVESALIGVYYFLSLYFVSELHFNIDTAGLILSCYGIGAIFGSIVGGQISDKMSSGLVMAYCLLIQAAAYFALLKLTSITLLMCIIGVLGFATYAFLTANHIWVLSQCKNDESERLKAINLLSTASNLGHGVSAMIISQTVIFGYHIIFSAVAAILFVVSASLFIWELRYKHVSIDRCDLASKHQKLGEVTAPIETGKKKLRVGIILLSVFLIGSVVAQFGSIYAVYIRDIFPLLGVNGVGILFATNAFFVVLFSAPLGNALKSCNKVLMAGVGGLLIGVGMSMLVVSSAFLFAVISCVIYTIGEIIFFSMAQLICYQSGHARKKGRSLGLYRTIYAMSRIAGPLAGGFVYLHFGGNVVWYLCGVTGIFCFFTCYLFKSG